MSDVQKVAKALGTSEQTIRRGFEQKALPFGAAVRCEKRYAYIVFPEKVKEYLGIDLRDQGGDDE